jgi:uncharacterized membrane protein
MRLAILYLHVLAVVVWVGGLVYQTHVLLPVARHGAVAPFAAAALRARPVTWTAIALVVLTGFYNVTQLGDLTRVMESGAGLMLAGKFTLVILAVALASQRDFAQLALLRGALASNGDPGPSLRAIARLDRIVLLLALIVMFLGLAVSRASQADEKGPSASLAPSAARLACGLRAPPRMWTFLISLRRFRRASRRPICSGPGRSGGGRRTRSCPRPGRAARHRPPPSPCRRPARRRPWGRWVG